jgi:acetoin utilization deacetylase AcuC-like enzyme
MIGFCSSPDFVLHQTPPGHPERPDRLRAIFQAVRAAGLIDSPNPLPPVEDDLGDFPAAGFKLRELPPAPAQLESIRAVHSQSHIDRVRAACQGRGILDDGDTPVRPESWNVALLSTGAILTCCDAVARGQLRRAFAAVRPPGHHAEPERAMGFCLFSNIAIAARYLQQLHGVGKIAIVDFDVHHGNGTQAVFESDGSVMFISLHQHPATCYPGTGFDSEIGSGPGRGLIVNIPMSPGSHDADYIEAMDHIVLPHLDQFKPEFLLLSAGFDAHRDDPLASIRLTEDGFSHITRDLVASAETHCNGRIVSALEGGYHLRALSQSLVRHLIALCD